MLKSLYDSDSHFFIEFETELFNCADWLKKFKEKVDTYQTRSFSDWLFPEYTEPFVNRFIGTLKSRYKLETNDIDELFSTSIFSVTDRTLRNQLTQLSQLKTQFLERQSINSKSTAKKPTHKFRKLSKAAFRKRSKAAFLELFETTPNFQLDETLEFFTNEVSTICRRLGTSWRKRLAPIYRW